MTSRQYLIKLAKCAKVSNDWYCSGLQGAINVESLPRLGNTATLLTQSSKYFSKALKKIIVSGQ
jgi:hypothetical protein